MKYSSDSVKALRGVVERWNKSKLEVQVASLSTWPAFLLPVSRNLEPADWPIAGEPVQGQRNAVFGLWKGAQSAPRGLLPIAEPIPGCLCLICDSRRHEFGACGIQSLKVGRGVIAATGMAYLAKVTTDTDPTLRKVTSADNHKQPRAHVLCSLT
jgi:hypothetical protein